MKKKSLFPFLLLVLAACGTSEIPSSSVTTSTPTSSAPSSVVSSSSSSEGTFIPIVTVPGQNILKDKVAADAVTLTEAYVFYNLPGSALLGAATAEGTVSVSYFGTELDSFRSAMEGLKEGDYVTFTGVVTISTGGDQARSKHLLINAAPAIVSSPSWSFNGFASASTVDMKEGFKAFANGINTNNLEVMYTFTNVEFLSIGNSGIALTNYDYLNYAALVAGKNEVVAGTSETDYLRLGIYKYTLNPAVFTTTHVFSIRAFLVGTNQNVPYAGGSNPILRLTGFVQVISKVAIAPTALTVSSAGNVTTLVETTTLQLTANFTPANTDNKNVTWSSDKPEFATVSSTGLVTAVAAGTAVIKAVSAAVSTLQGTITLTVTAPVPVASLTVTSPENVTEVIRESTLQLTANILPTDAFVKTVTWTTSDATKATVSATGLVTGVANGSVRITATSVQNDQISNFIDLTVVPPPTILISLDLTASVTQLDVAQKLTLGVAYEPTGYTGSKELTWVSSAPSIATVSDAGLVTAVGYGSVTITITSVAFALISDSVSLTISKNIVINEVYGGGGNMGAAYTNDFIELYNPNSFAVNLQGYVIQYASATGNFNNLAGSFTFTSAHIIAANGYFLAQFAAGTTVTNSPLPTPDAIMSTSPLNFSGTVGKVALLKNNTQAMISTAGQVDNTLAFVSDFVGFGLTANQWEGAVVAPATNNTTPAPSNSTSVNRVVEGVDTNNNKLDFAAGAPSPRNSAYTPS
jgi:uncharacterized protein YjdB